MVTHNKTPLHPTRLTLTIRNTMNKETPDPNLRPAPEDIHTTSDTTSDTASSTASDAAASTASDAASDTASDPARDRRLLTGIQAGDPEPLRQLMDLYDRLIRFAIYRTAKSECTRDPAFLDSCASDVWLALIQRVRRDGPDIAANLRSYLIQIARNKCNDHWRKSNRDITRHAPQDSTQDNLSPLSPHSPHSSETSTIQYINTSIIDASPDPSEMVIDIEDLERIRDCVRDFPENDRKLLQELDLLTSARWKEAASRLKIPESTLRSRWTALLQKLRHALSQKH